MNIRFFYAIKQIIYFLIAVILGGMIINGEPIAFFVIGACLMTISIAYLKNYNFILRFLIPDFKSKSKVDYRKASRFCFWFGMILLIWGIYEIIW